VPVNKQPMTASENFIADFEESKSIFCKEQQFNKR